MRGEGKIKQGNLKQKNSIMLMHGKNLSKTILYIVHIETCNKNLNETVILFLTKVHLMRLVDSHATEHVVLQCHTTQQ